MRPSSYSMQVASYTLAALFGSVIAASSMSFGMIPVFILLFDMSLASAVYLTSIVSFLFYLTCLLVCYCMPSSIKAWLFLLAVSVVGASMYWSLMPL